MALSRKCFVGDEILAVEGESLEDMEHYEASETLREAAESMRVQLRLRLFPAGEPCGGVSLLGCDSGQYLTISFPDQHATAFWPTICVPETWCP